MREYRNFKDYHIEKLRDPEESRIYLDVALEEYQQDGDTEAFLLALRDVAEAQGGITKLAERTRLNRHSIKLSPQKGTQNSRLWRQYSTDWDFVFQWNQLRQLNLSKPASKTCQSEPPIERTTLKAKFPLKP